MRLKTLLAALEELAPLALAESWDRVGLQVGDPEREVRRGLLCIDLTEAVMAEAARAELIVAYHPPIFAPLRRLTPSSWRERIIVTAIERRIAIYSPHTALDAARGGLAEWLAAGVGAGDTRPITPHGDDDAEVGAGRILELRRALAAKTLVARVKQHLGLDHVKLARPRGRTRPIRRVALCPGAGGSLFEGLRSVDAYVTGEMRHHDVLAAVQRGQTVLLTGHTNSERPYLPVLRRRLRAMTRGVTWRISRADRAPIKVV